MAEPFLKAAVRSDRSEPFGSMAAGIREEPSRMPFVAEGADGADAGERLRLQRWAPSNARRHLARSLVRFGVLFLADMTVLWLVRFLLRAIEDGGVLGVLAADVARWLLPHQYLDGWQLAVAFAIGLASLGTYGPGDRRRDASRLLMATALAVALPLWQVAWALTAGVVLINYLAITGVVWLALLAERQLLDPFAHLNPFRRGAARTLFLGTREQYAEVVRSTGILESGEYRGAGFLDDSPVPHPESAGTLGELSTVIHDRRIEAIVVCGQLPEHRYVQVVDQTLAAGCQLLAVPPWAHLAGVQPSLIWKQGHPLVEMTTVRLKSQQLVVKRLLDVVGSALALIVFGPVMLVIAVAIKLDTRGPVFFSQERVGQGGRTFRIFKFRTMVDGAELQRADLLSRSVYDDPRLFKIQSDPRTTRVGCWLRRTSLDELPQIVNVLRGEMSLVGPRPPLPAEVALYESRHYVRFDVRPGMTGPWQVGGRNEITDFEQVVALESDYIREWSLTRDLGILLRTIPAVLRMRGAH